MALPNAIFVDTNVFDRQHYNFTGSVLTSFAQACQRHGIVLLLPDPISRELNRHVRTRALEAYELVSKGRRIAPFLDAIRQDRRSTLAELDSYSRMATAALDSYLQQFKLVELGYEGLDLKELMDWYDAQTPPFGSAGKRKEFPDAFAVAMVERFATTKGMYVAVVSDDKGVKAVCDRYTKLSYFTELTALTELLVNDEEQVTAYKAIVEADRKELESQIAAIAAELSFYHHDRDYSINWSKVLEARIVSMRIVALGHDECTVTFVAEVDAEHELEWSELETEEGDIDCTEELVEPSPVTGLAKVQVDRSAKRVTCVVMVEVDQRMLRVTETPTRYL
jgi:hypothetical protein